MTTVQGVSDEELVVRISDNVVGIIKTFTHKSACVFWFDLLPGRWAWTELSLIRNVSNTEHARMARNTIEKEKT